MHIVIVGEGKVGFALTQQLSREGHDLVVIDNRPAALRQSDDVLDVFTVEVTARPTPCRPRQGLAGLIFSSPQPPRTR